VACSTSTTARQLDLARSCFGTTRGTIPTNRGDAKRFNPGLTQCASNTEPSKHAALSRTASGSPIGLRAARRDAKRVGRCRHDCATVRVVVAQFRGSIRCRNHPVTTWHLPFVHSSHIQPPAHPSACPQLGGRQAVRVHSPIVEEIHAIREVLSKASYDDIRKIAQAAKARLAAGD
jgi:hypothetical protein